MTARSGGIGGGWRLCGGGSLGKHWIAHLLSYAAGCPEGLWHYWLGWDGWLRDRAGKMDKPAMRSSGTGAVQWKTIGGEAYLCLSD